MNNQNYMIMTKLTHMKNTKLKKNNEYLVVDIKKEIKKENESKNE